MDNSFNVTQIKQIKQIKQILLAFGERLPHKKLSVKSVKSV